MSHKNLSVKTKIHKFLRDKLKDKKVKLVYKKFEKSLNINENFGVAISGGPDSLALAFFAQIYSLKRKINPKFFIVDHRLRPESTKEAKAVQKILRRVSINLEILIWKGKKPKNNIQSIARKARYQLMSNRCEKYKIKNLLVGHHQDDLIENFFIRMVRGSGLKGLVSMGKKSKIEKMNIYRPLIDQKKDDLILVSKKVFDFYIKDPSNNDEKFQRTRIRKLIKELKKDGFDMNKFLKTIKNLKYSNNIINFYVAENLKQNTFYSNKDKRLILSKSFFLKSYEVVFRGLSDLLKKIGGKYYSVRGKKLEKMIYDIQNNRLFKSTLGGCIVEKVNHTIIISKEG